MKSGKQQSAPASSWSAENQCFMNLLYSIESRATMAGVPQMRGPISCMSTDLITPNTKVFSTVVKRGLVPRAEMFSTHHIRRAKSEEGGHDGSKMPWEAGPMDRRLVLRWWGKTLTRTSPCGFSHLKNLRQSKKGARV